MLTTRLLYYDLYVGPSFSLLSDVKLFSLFSPTLSHR